MKLELKNYQAWETADIEANGLTVIIGESDIGKSAIVRALKGLLRNDVPAGKIRKGTDRTKIRMTLDSGDRIELNRGTKTSSEYEVNDTKYVKLGSDVPEEIKAFGLSEIAIGGLTIDPIFSKQFDGQFLLSSSPSEINTVLGAFASTEKLDAGRKAISEKIRDKDAEAKLLAAQVGVKEEKLHNIDQVLTPLWSLRGVTTELAVEVGNLKKAATNVRLQTVWSRLHEAMTEFVEHTETVSMDEVNTLSATIETFNRLLYSNVRAKRRRAYYESIHPMTMLADEVFILSHCVDLITGLQNTRIVELKNTLDKFSDIPTTIELSQSVVVKETLEKLLDSLPQIDKLKSEAVGIDKELTVVEKDITELKRSFIKCPKCQFEFVPEEAHDHE